MYLNFAKILMISSLSELEITKIKKESTPSELKNVKVKNKLLEFFIQVHLVYLFKNQHFNSKNRKKGNKTELIL